MWWLWLLGGLVLLGILFALQARYGITRYLPWIDFNGNGGRSAIDKNLMRVMEDDVTEQARVQGPKDLAP